MADFDKLWNYGDPAATEQKFLELLPQAEAGNDADYLAQLITQIARTKSVGFLRCTIILASHILRCSNMTKRTTSFLVSLACSASAMARKISTPSRTRRKRLGSQVAQRSRSI